MEYVLVNPSNAMIKMRKLICKLKKTKKMNGIRKKINGIIRKKD